MAWYETLTLIMGGVLVLLGLGVPVAFALIGVTLIGVTAFQGWGGPSMQYVTSIKTSLSNFTLLPVPLFVLMGEILWHSSIAKKALAALDKLMGRLPGRLSLLTVASGTLFSSLSGSTMANTALLGKMLVPEMKRRGYGGVLSIGPILGSGGLAMLIPPSALAVIFASVAQVSIGQLLLALLVPGLLLAFCYVLFILVVAIMRPDLAPAYEITTSTAGEKVRAVLLHVVPLSSVVILVVGVIHLGIATPTEAAALGCIGSFTLAFAYGGLSFSSLRKSLAGTARITVMMLTILAAAIGFSQLLAFTGASRGLLLFVVGEIGSPTLFIIATMLLILVLGCFLEQIAIMLVTLPILMPIVQTLQIDPIWFSVMMLINLEIALMTPPFGMLLFVLRGVTPPSITLSEIYWSAVPFVIINLIVILLILMIPQIALYLPSIAFD
jgi:tripartite ATP-independent transporter DctM subunit